MFLEPRSWLAEVGHTIKQMIVLDILLPEETVNTNQVQWMKEKTTNFRQLNPRIQCELVRTDDNETNHSIMDITIKYSYW